MLKILDCIQLFGSCWIGLLTLLRFLFFFDFYLYYNDLLFVKIMSIQILRVSKLVVNIYILRIKLYNRKIFYLNNQVSFK